MVGADDRTGGGRSQPGLVTNHKHQEDSNAATNAGTKNEHQYPGLRGLKEKWGQAGGSFYICVGRSARIIQNCCNRYAIRSSFRAARISTVLMCSVFIKFAKI